MMLGMFGLANGLSHLLIHGEAKILHDLRLSLHVACLEANGGDGENMLVQLASNIGVLGRPVGCGHRALGRNALMPLHNGNVKAG